jgi:hypothetical protein
MKRYDFEATGWDIYEMVERESGDYVEYDEMIADRAKDKEEIARLKNALNIIYYLDPIEGKKEYLKRIKAIAREALEGNNARKD